MRVYAGTPWHNHTRGTHPNKNVGAALGVPSTDAAVPSSRPHTGLVLAVPESAADPSSVAAEHGVGGTPPSLSLVAGRVAVRQALNDTLSVALDLAPLLLAGEVRRRVGGQHVLGGLLLGERVQVQGAVPAGRDNVAARRRGDDVGNGARVAHQSVHFACGRALAGGDVGVEGWEGEDVHGAVDAAGRDQNVRGDLGGRDPRTRGGTQRGRERQSVQSRALSAEGQDARVREVRRDKNVTVGVVSERP